MTISLSLDDLVGRVADVGLGPMRDLGLFEGAAHRPSAHHFGVELYDDLDVKTAVLMESIVRNHPIVDGNKQLGWLAAVIIPRSERVHAGAPMARRTTSSSAWLPAMCRLRLLRVI